MAPPWYCPPQTLTSGKLEATMKAVNVQQLRVISQLFCSICTESCCHPHTSLPVYGVGEMNADFTTNELWSEVLPPVTSDTIKGSDIYNNYACRHCIHLP